MAEKQERSLTTHLPTKITKAIMSLSLPDSLKMSKLPAVDSTARFNPLSWNNALLRLVTCESIPTDGHPNKTVETYHNQVAVNANTALLESAAKRKRDLAANALGECKVQLIAEAEENERMFKAIREDLQKDVEWEVCWSVLLPEGP